MKLKGAKIQFPNDLIAALTASISAFPDAMSAAVMAGANPFHGLFATIAGRISGAWSTSSVYMTVATTSALALAAGSGLKDVSESEKLSAIILLTMSAGIIQLIMGFLRLGFLVKFVSNSVMRGFLTGIAVLIILGQTSDFLGAESDYKNKVIATSDMLFHPGQWNFYSIGTTILMIVLIHVFNKTKIKKISIFFTLVIVAFSVNIFFPDTVNLVGTDSSISGALPDLKFPDFSLFPKIIFSAFSVAMIGFIQGAGISQMKPNPDGNYPDESNDLAGQGIANIVSGSVSGIPVGGSMGQTTLIYSSGGRSRWANFLCGIIIGIIVLFLSSLIELIPLACFAAILILAGFDSINKEEITTIWETSIHSRLIMTFSFIVTISLTVPQAVLFSIILTFFLHVIRASNRITLRRIFLKNDEIVESAEIPKKLGKKEIIALQPYGSIFFAGAYSMNQILPETTEAEQSVVLLGMRGKKEVGSTFIQVIQRYSKELKEHDCKLILVGISDNVFLQFERTGLLDYLGKENIYKPTKILGKAFRDAWKDAELWISRRGN